MRHNPLTEYYARVAAMAPTDNLTTSGQLPLSGLHAERKRQDRFPVIWFALVGLMAFLVQWSTAQEQSSPSSATPGQSAQTTSAPPHGSFELSDDVVRDVLSNFQRGFETLSIDKVLEGFDPQDMPDYSDFRAQLVAFFRLHDRVKLRYQLLQVSADGDSCTATVDLEMEDDPSDTLPTPQRRSTQMRFQLKREAKGWRIIGLRPADFFAP